LIPDEKLTPQLQDVPDNPIRLQQGWLACRTCGVAVQTPSYVVNGEEVEVPVINVESAGRAVEGAAAIALATQNQRPIPLSFALCRACRRSARWPSS